VTCLYHYTCIHGFRAIVRSADENGYVWLEPQGGRFLWLTDLEYPFRDALGLTSHLLTCDRTEFRFQVLQPEGVERWVRVRRHYPTMQHLERSPGAAPMHWWISDHPQLAKLAMSDNGV
jgi:hypothetical protein